MRRRHTVLSIFVIVGGIAVSTAGCTSISATVADSIATVDSNAKTIDSNFRRVLGGYQPTDEEKAHWQAATLAQDDLSGLVNEWAQKHKKE